MHKARIRKSVIAPITEAVQQLGLHVMENWTDNGICILKIVENQVTNEVITVPIWPEDTTVSCCVVRNNDDKVRDCVPIKNGMPDPNRAFPRFAYGDKETIRKVVDSVVKEATDFYEITEAPKP